MNYKINLFIPQSKKFLKQKGFTLIELIFTMIIVAILAGVIAVFVKGPVTAFFENTKRADFSDNTETFYRQLELDLQHALPNSFRYRTDSTNGIYYLEFVTTKDYGMYRRYLDETQAGYTFNDKIIASKGHLIVNLNPKGTVGNIAETQFEILGRRLGFKSGDYIVLCNFGPNTVGTNIYNGDNLAQINFATMNNTANPTPLIRTETLGTTYKISNYVYLKTATEFSCPLNYLNRFWIVNEPVTYAFRVAERYPDKSYKPFTGGVWRYSNYGILTEQPVLSITEKATSTNGIKNLDNINTFPSLKVSQVASDIREGSLRYFPTALPNADLVTARMYIRKAKYNSVHQKEDIVFYREYYVSKAP